MIKQVLIVRKDLNMRKGKIAAQAAHASMKVFFDRKTLKASMPNDVSHQTRLLDMEMVIPLTPSMYAWVTGNFAKICVSVDSEQELLDVYKKAQEAGLVCSLVTDSGLTEFHGVPTNTVVAIGPDRSEEIDKITGSLKLL